MLPPVLEIYVVWHPERGSFLMDHVPRVPVRRLAGGWSGGDVEAGLAVLVDECLKRTLWERQRELAVGRPDLDVMTPRLLAARGG